MKKWLKRTAVVLICLVGLWCILLALRRPWIEPIPGVRLDPTRPILLEKDVKPNSAFDLLRRACAAHTTDSNLVLKALDEVKSIPWSLDGATNTLAVLDQTKECLELARCAAETPEPQVPTIKSFDETKPYLAKARAISRCFNISAQAKTVQGDYSRAFADLCSAIGFSSILTRGGVLIEHLVAIACCNMSCKTMRQIALNYPVHEDLLQDTIRFLEETENGLEPWVECMRHEFILARTCVDEFSKDPSSFSLAWQGNAWRPAFRALYVAAPLMGSTINTMRKDIEACFTHFVSMAEKPYDKAAYDRFEEPLHPDCLGPGIFLTSRDPFGQILAEMLFGGQGVAHARHVFMIAELRATRIVFAIVMFKRDEGRLPQALDDLVPKYLDKVPDDPFDSKTMKYRVNSDGSWVVYSVGKDGKDDGGIEEPNDLLGANYHRGRPDLIFGPSEAP